jgi:hypothetical protein
MRFIFTLLLLLTCAPAWAKWVLVLESSDSWFYMEPSTIRKAGQYRRVWALINFRQQVSFNAHSARIHQQYDCKEERYRILRHESYTEWMAGGKMVASLIGPEKWDAIAPGSAAQIIFKKVCAK